MKKTITILFLLGICSIAYSNEIRNINIKSIDRNGYISTTLNSSQIYNLLIEFDYYSDKSFICDDDIKVSIASYGVGGDWLFEVPNIKPGTNRYSVKIKSLSKSTASYFPAGQYNLLIKSGMADNKFRSFSIIESKSYANTYSSSTSSSSNSGTSYSSGTSSSSSSNSGTSLSAGAVIAAAGLGLLAAVLSSRDDNKDSGSKSDTNGDIHWNVWKDNVNITTYYISHEKLEYSPGKWRRWDLAHMNIKNNNSYRVKVIFKAKLKDGSTRVSGYLIMEPKEYITDHQVGFGDNFEITELDIYSVERY